MPPAAPHVGSSIWMDRHSPAAQVPLWAVPTLFSGSHHPCPIGTISLTLLPVMGGFCLLCCVLLFGGPKVGVLGRQASSPSVVLAPQPLPLLWVAVWDRLEKQPPRNTTPPRFSGPSPACVFSQDPMGPPWDVTSMELPTPRHTCRQPVYSYAPGADVP